MATVVFFGADGRKAGCETAASRRDALTLARQYVSRHGMNTYRTRRTQDGATIYYHSYGEREAHVRDEPPQEEYGCTTC